jgi:protein Mpv17
LQKRINLSTHNKTIAARVLADQVVFSTAHMAVFLSSMAIMEGTDPKEKLQKSYISGLKANYMVWPLVQAINFKFVPLDLRVLVVNFVSLGWNCFLSYLNQE